jgi:nitrite reductase/ring-hydroxylating ferredoxin subunit
MKTIEFSFDRIQKVQDILQADERKISPYLLQESVPDLGTEDIPTEIFFSKSYHDLEVEKLWKKVWQVACLESDLEKVGDHVVYNIAHLSAIVVRSAPNEIRAFYNACLHRGTQLRVNAGRVSGFQCPFHGWKWNLDGTLAGIPCRWDFKQVEDEAFRLPELKVAIWQGIVFVNFDADCEPLESYLENIPEQFQHLPCPPEERFTAVHIIKTMPANWKVTLEAFVESYHFAATHPQVLPFTGIARCDLYDRHSRSILPVGVSSPYLDTPLDENDLSRALAIFEGEDPETVRLEGGMTARACAANAARLRLQGSLGIDTSSLPDSYVLDVMSYQIFPNLVLTPSLSFPVLMTFRPDGDDPDTSIMEVRLLLPCPPGPRPANAKPHRLGEGDKWSSVPEFARIGTVFDQDTANLSRIQKGLKASAKAGITLGEYQESIIRHFHRSLDRQLHP